MRRICETETKTTKNQQQISRHDATRVKRIKFEKYAQLPCS